MLYITDETNEEKSKQMSEDREEQSKRVKTIDAGYSSIENTVQKRLYDRLKSKAPSAHPQNSVKNDKI